jgi:hypothetical protein
MLIRKALATIAVLTVTAGSLSACGDTAGPTAAQGGSSAAVGSSAPSSASASPSDDASDASSGRLDKDSLIEAITTGPTEAGSAHMTMNMDGSMSLSAEGDVGYGKSGPEMSMTMEMPQMGAGKIDLRMVGGIMYMTIPTLTPAGKFLRIDPNDKSNPLTKSFGGLSDQMDPLSSVAAMKDAVRKVTFVGPEMVDGEDADHYVLTVDTARMMRKMKQKNVAGMPATLEYDMWLDSKDLLRRMQFAVAGLDVTMTMSKWGEPVSISAPPKSRIVDPSSLGAQAG